ncbi:Uncharacterized protein FWK35_00025608 [Aphis craccivora]|uniref:Uncharacterized protein n=1 Tax=Aphis craccivora TaxID=307492 RepID=A0A6G0W2C1_APHCR|nr:Uncharacterized protein FWK35_00025608 [Aphis craccivora]
MINLRALLLVSVVDIKIILFLKISYSIQISTINTPDVSAGFIDFLANGEFDEMLSNTPKRMYYNNLLSQGENISTRNDIKHISDDCVNQQQTADKPNDIDSWGCEDSDYICLEELDKYIWGEE